MTAMGEINKMWSNHMIDYYTAVKRNKHVYQCGWVISIICMIKTSCRDIWHDNVFVKNFKLIK